MNIRRFFILSIVTIFLTTASPAMAKRQFLSIATGGTTGVYYALGGTLSQLIDQKIQNVRATAEVTGGTVANLRMLASDEAQIGFAVADICYYAYHGIEQFEKEGKGRYQGLRAIASLYPEVVQVITMADSGIQTIDQLKGKRVAVGPAGSGTMVNARLVMGLYDIKFDDCKVDYFGWSEASMGLADHNIDAAFIWSGLPNASVLDLATLNKIEVVSLTSDAIGKIQKDWPFFSVVNIPKDTYKGMSKDATSVAAPALLVVSDKMSDELAYQVTKQVFDNVSTFAASHKRGEDISLETAFDGVGLPLHPGAVKFFVEKGVEIPMEILPEK